MLLLVIAVIVPASTLAQGTGAGTRGSTTGAVSSGSAQVATSSASTVTTRLADANVSNPFGGTTYTASAGSDKVSFSLEDADLNELVRVIGQLTGRRFIFGGKVRNIKASVYAPQKVTVDEAYQAFLSILETNGLTVVPHGRFLKIIETGAIATQATPTYSSGSAAPNEDRFVTRLFRAAHSSAEEIANVLGHFKSKDGDVTVAPSSNLIIITDTGSNIRRMMQIVEEIDVGSGEDRMWIEPIHYASASEIAARLNELFDLRGSAQGSKSEAGPLHIAKVTSDARSNSVVIVASEPSYLRALELLKRLDVPQTGDGELHVVALQHADVLELTKTLNELVQGGGGGAVGAPPGDRAARPAVATVFEGAIKISADKSTNSLVVTSSLRDFAALHVVIDRLDQPRRQVFIEAIIMDLSVTRSRQLGVDFHIAGLSDLASGGQSLLYGGLNPLETVSALGSDTSVLQGLALGIRGPGIPGTSSLSSTGTDIPAFGAIIQALATTGDSDVLSTPHILATDNVKAEINVGQNIPLQQNIASVASSSSSASSLVGLSAFGAAASPQRQDVGTKIIVTPHLNESNEVRLELAEEISEAGDAVGQLGVVPINKRTANTMLTVRDQQTVVIGGLIRNRIAHSETKIPILGDIPILGMLFRQTKNEMQKSNLLLVLTPYIIREQGDLRRIFERKLQERQEFLDRYFVFNENDDFKRTIDYTHTNGLLEDIKATYRANDEAERLESTTTSRQPLEHTPTMPLDLPAQPTTAGRTNVTVPQSTRTTSPTAPAHD